MHHLKRILRLAPPGKVLSWNFLRERKFGLSANSDWIFWYGAKNSQKAVHLCIRIVAGSGQGLIQSVNFPKECQFRLNFLRWCKFKLNFPILCTKFSKADAPPSHPYITGSGQGFKSSCLFFYQQEIRLLHQIWWDILSYSHHATYALFFSDFCAKYLSERKFMKCVTFLNANIVMLCLSQNVDPSLLQPAQTIRNLLLLLNPAHSDLGRCVWC